MWKNIGRVKMVFTTDVCVQFILFFRSCYLAFTFFCLFFFWPSVSAFSPSVAPPPLPPLIFPSFLRLTCPPPFFSLLLPISPSPSFFPCPVFLPLFLNHPPFPLLSFSSSLLLLTSYTRLFFPFLLFLLSPPPYAFFSFPPLLLSFSFSLFPPPFRLSPSAPDPFPPSGNSWLGLVALGREAAAGEGRPAARGEQGLPRGRGGSARDRVGAGAPLQQHDLQPGPSCQTQRAQWVSFLAVFVVWLKDSVSFFFIILSLYCMYFSYLHVCWCIYWMNLLFAFGMELNVISIFHHT